MKRIVVPKPPVGAKCWVLTSGGKYLLEEQPGVLLHLTCPHAGSGSVRALDLDGRMLLDLSPAAMGVWHLGAGFQHGLLIEASGGSVNLAPIVSVVWYTKPEKVSERVFNERKCVQIVHGAQIICREDCILYEVLISKGSSGTIEIFDGQGTLLFVIPSIFRGSFNLEHVWAAGGLSVMNSGVLNSVSVTFLTEPKST